MADALVYQYRSINPALETPTKWSDDTFKGSDQWKMRGGREAGKCLKVVPDHDDRCLFIFLWSRRLFCNVFPFPACKAQLIGDWYENRRGARNTIIFLIIRQYYWRNDAPCANSNGWPNTKKNYWRTVPGQHCLLAEGTLVRQYIGAPMPPAPIYWRTKMYRNVRILSRQGDQRKFWRIFHAIGYERIKRGGPNSSVRFAYFQANRLLT